MSDQEISQALHSLLHDYSTSQSQSSAAPLTSMTAVVHHLESKLGVDLSPKVDFIRSQLQQFLFQPPPPQQQPPPQHHHQQQPFPPPQSYKDRYAPHQTPNFLLSSGYHPPHQTPNFLLSPGYPSSHSHPQQQQQQQQPQHHHQQQFPPPPSYKDHYAPNQTPNFLLSSGYSPSPSPGSVLSPRAVRLESSAPAAAPPLESPKESSKGKRKGGAGGLNKLCGVSPELQVVVGHPALPRTEIVKQLWVYIRKHNLQDPSNKRKIICDDALRVVFETDCTDMFKMNKLLSKHILRLDPAKEASAKKQKVEDDEELESESTQAPPALAVSPAPAPSAAIEDEEKESQDTQDAPAPAPAPSVGISEELANFFGVGERVMLQSELFTRLWEYINANNLEDLVNPTVIVCDSKLQELFGCQSFPAAKLMEVLARQHIFRA
ncbi:unnamed protein product [Linum trigynum]|uniref:DM2 domain-containing protein n=1 Tax=Linum trigynum TaxID=586398 RepID=A0AAV2CD06_9ROSI